MIQLPNAPTQKAVLKINLFNPKKETRNTRAFIFLVAFFFNSLLFAQTNVSKYSFNGQANTIVNAPDGSTLLGGNFDSVGLYSGSGVYYNGNTQEWNQDFAKVEGEIFAVINIPTAFGGGWYIGGDISSVDGQNRNHLARLNADGSLHPYNPIGINGNVLALALDSNGNLYVGGEFNTYNLSTPSVRNHLAKYDADGNLTDFSPNMTSPTRTIFIDANDNVFVGGDFIFVNGVSREKIAKFDSNGNLTAFNPQFNNPVLTITSDADGFIYVML